MKYLIYLLFSMTIFTSCDKTASGANAPAVNNTVAQTKLNVSYGKETAQRMDIYLPAGRSAATTKSIILIHGGGWNGGDKSEFATYIDTFKKRLPDYAIFNINYRLVTNNTLFPSQENDVKAAVDFIASRSNEYGINKEKLVLLGVSAGGHLALLQAYKYNDPKVKAVIDFFGPTDLTTMYNNAWHPLVTYALQMVTGTTPSAKPEIYLQSSPTNFITKESAPTLILHGALDQVVDVSQSRLLKEKLENAGVAHELVVYPNERHGWYGATMTNSFNRIEAFLNVHVK